MKKLTGICFILMFLLSGCSVEKADNKKVRDLEFTVVEEKEVPEELEAIIEEKKEKEFKITYDDGADLYIVVGYGPQKTGGYSVSINELYLSENAVYISTSLIGPSQEDQKTEATTYPHIVLKTEYIDKSVVFQ